MAMISPPMLPAFLEALLPFSRGAYQLERGVHAGAHIHYLEQHSPRTSSEVAVAKESSAQEFNGSETTPPKSSEVAVAKESSAPLAIVMLHGNPTWSFLWRKVFTALKDSGLWCLAPDLLGLGLSTKLRRVRDHSVAGHVEAISEWVEAMGAEELVLVGQDWGGPIAAGVGASFPSKVKGLVLANTSVLVPQKPRGTAFHRFARLPLISDICFRGLGMPQVMLSRVQGDPTSIQGEVAAAYRWPLRRIADRSAPLAMARMVPDRLDHPSIPALRRGEEWVRQFEGPVALVWGERDPILGRALKRHAEALPHAAMTRTNAGHFLQEEVPQALADAIRGVVAQCT